MTSEVSAQLNSLRSRSMAEFYSRVFERPRIILSRQIKEENDANTAS
jgi:hypothetical protein